MLVRPQDFQGAGLGLLSAPNMKLFQRMSAIYSDHYPVGAHLSNSHYLISCGLALHLQPCAAADLSDAAHSEGCCIGDLADAPWNFMTKGVVHL